MDTRRSRTGHHRAGRDPRSGAVAVVTAAALALLVATLAAPPGVAGAPPAGAGAPVPVRGVDVVFDQVSRTDGLVYGSALDENGARQSASVRRSAPRS